MKNKIANEILNYKVLKNIIEVEFEDYILEVDLKDLKGMEINKDNLAEVINNKYRSKDFLEKRLEVKLEYLYKMLEKYHKLNSKTNNKFDWRERAIDDQISVLEDLKNNKSTDWDTCFEEDSEDLQDLN